MRSSGPETERRSRAGSLGIALAGPLAIVGCVLILMRGFAFQGMLSSQHVDILPMWTPTFTFLGRSLASGHIPAWNPYSMGGVPFAADPQSGWTYLPAMLLFSLFSGDVAIRLFVVLQPILAGLGVYWFCRSEGLRRAASSVGGLCLGVVMANSVMSQSLPFAGTMAWTALLIAAASRAVRALAWSGRLGWILAAGVCWGQLANAHLSNGLVMGTALLAIYLVVALVREVRTGTIPKRQGVRLGVLLAGALPLIDLAVLLPRAAYLPSTTIAAGYNQLDAWGRALTGVSTRSGTVGYSAPTSWPSMLANPPGPYLGLLALILALAWWRSARHRWLGVPIAIYCVVSYLLSLQVVAKALAPLVSNTTLGQFYVHEPYRFTFAAVFAVCVLAGLGADALLVSGSLRASLKMIAPGVLMWAVLWSIATPKHAAWLVLVGVLLVAACIAALGRSRALGWVLPATVALEMTVAGLLGQESSYLQDEQTLRAPTVDAAAYLSEGPIANRLASAARAGERYVSWQPRLGVYGFERLQEPADRGALAGERSMIFGLDDVGGYNPTQLVRYWTLVRALDPKPMFYNAAFLSQPPATLLDLLDVHWVVANERPPWVLTPVEEPASAADSFRNPLIIPSAIATDGKWSLFPIPDPAPAASVVGKWSVVSGPDAALAAVREPDFDPRDSVVLEGTPGLAPGADPQSGAATFEWNGLGDASVKASTTSPTMLLIRVPYQKNWHATLDGKPVEVILADYLDMAVALPTTGNHTVNLTYTDPTIGYGLAGSAVSILALAAAALVCRRRERSTAVADQ